MPALSVHSINSSDTGSQNNSRHVLTGCNGDDWFLINRDGDNIKDKSTEMSTFESHYFEDIAWLTSGLRDPRRSEKVAVRWKGKRCPEPMHPKRFLIPSRNRAF